MMELQVPKFRGGWPLINTLSPPTSSVCMLVAVLSAGNFREPCPRPRRRTFPSARKDFFQFLLFPSSGSLGPSGPAACTAHKADSAQLLLLLAQLTINTLETAVTRRPLLYSYALVKIFFLPPSFGC